MDRGDRQFETLPSQVPRSPAKAVFGPREASPAVKRQAVRSRGISRNDAEQPSLAQARDRGALLSALFLDETRLGCVKRADRTCPLTKTSCKTCARTCAGQRSRRSPCLRRGVTTDVRSLLSKGLVGCGRARATAPRRHAKAKGRWTGFHLRIRIPNPPRESVVAFRFRQARATLGRGALVHRK
jgi:hypothetical protein